MMAGKTSVSDLVSRSERALELGDTNTALRLVHDFVERIVTEPLCAAQVFASRALDQLCQRIGQKNVSKLRLAETNPTSTQKNRTVAVYLASRLQRSGGHSRLIRDFIRAQPDIDHLIISTEVGGPSDKAYFSELFSDIGSVQCVYAPKGNFEARLIWVQSTLIATQPVHIYLFNHHQDSVAVAACVPELKLSGSFCHHGDHHLCLGVHLDHFSHIDFHPMGFHYCRDELEIDNRYLPLTFEDKGLLPVDTSFRRDRKLTTATVARSNKVEIPYYVSYVDSIPRILKATGGRHVHIGNLTPWALRRIYKLMRREEIPLDRFVYIDWTASVWKTLQTQHVDVYIASFPYGAGLTLIEVMGAGIPVIMHRHMFSRVLSSLELAYPEAFSWNELEQLLVHLCSLRPEKLEQEKKLARSQYEKFHQQTSLHEYLTNIAAIHIAPQQLNRDFKPRLDEWASWASTQLSFGRLAYRFCYRILRTLRRSLS
jgi:hypothetical protein